MYSVDGEEDEDMSVMREENVRGERRMTYLQSGLAPPPPKTCARKSTIKGNSSTKAGLISTSTSAACRLLGKDASCLFELCMCRYNMGGGVDACQNP